MVEKAVNNHYGGDIVTREEMINYIHKEAGYSMSWLCEKPDKQLYAIKCAVEKRIKKEEERKKKQKNEQSKWRRGSLKQGSLF